MLPSRLQCSRRKGARLPEGTIYVGRPTKWGNPYKAGAELPARDAVARYESDLLAGKLTITAEDARRELRGKSLACWCPPGAPCHADVLLEIVNAD